MENIENRPPRLLTRHDLYALGIRYSNTHLLYLENLGIFPKRIRLTPQRIVWDEAEMMAWLEKCRQGRK